MHEYVFRVMVGVKDHIFTIELLNFKLWEADMKTEGISDSELLNTTTNDHLLTNRIRIGAIRQALSAKPNGWFSCSRCTRLPPRSERQRGCCRYRS
jgi:hypothetical protein